MLSSPRRNRPGIAFYLAPGGSGDLHGRVAEGALDAAILVRPPFSLPKHLDWASLRHEPLVLVAPTSDREGQPRRLLEGQPVIRYDRNRWGGRLVDLYLRRGKVRPNEFCELDTLEAITLLVSRGLGVSLIPDWRPPWPEGVSVRRFEAPRSPTHEIGIAWSEASKRLPLIRAFVEEALDASPLRASAAGARTGRRRAKGGRPFSVSAALP